MEENFDLKKGNKIKELLENRKNQKLAKYIAGMVILLILMLVFGELIIKSNSTEYLDYTETAGVDYKVYLNENSYYEKDYQDENEQYVSSLIKNINADFSYNIKMQDDATYTYKYRIEATVNVADSTTKNSLYSKTNTLVAETTENGSGTSNISKQVILDYSEYNNIANNFVNEYSLSTQSESTLTVNLYVKAENAEESVVTLTIPLVDKTIAISTDTNLVTESNSQIAIVKNNKFQRNGSILGIFACFVGIIALVLLSIKNEVDSSTEENIYNSEKKDILRSYGSVINKLDSYNIEFEKYQILTLNSFVDLLKIKEDISKPILMVENKEKTNTVFFIPNDANIIYMFVLGKKTEMLAEKNVNYDDKIEEKVTK